MRKLLFRSGVFFAGLLLISLLSNLGIVDRLVNSTLGLVVYWAYLIVLTLWLILAVGPVAFAYFYRRT